MAGIVSYGAYVPPTRLALAALSGGVARDGGPEKAVAWNDEDALTLGAAAGLACLRGLDRSGVDALFFASTSSPFQEKQAAALLARALGLGARLRTADVTGSLRAGLGALRAAQDAVDAGSARLALVVAADCRMAPPGSALERQLGDAAAAFLVGTRDVIADLEGAFAVSDEMVDRWRTPSDPFVHSWEERFVVQEGYLPRMREALGALLEALGVPAASIDRLVLDAPDARTHAALARALGVPKDALQDPFFGRIGSAGCAAVPLQLAAALEAARPGERLALAAYGDGAEAIALRVLPAIEKLAPRRGVSWHLARRRSVPGITLYQRARGLVAGEYPEGRDAGLSATIHFRERDEDLALTGQRCQCCGAVQFPRQRVCASCFARDRFEDARLAERPGRVVTYTLDYFFPTPEPPTIVTITEIEGARLHLQLVDCAPDAVRIGLPVEPVFRCIHRVGGRPNYYWKAVVRPEDPR